jgi:hypothetical protein
MLRNTESDGRFGEGETFARKGGEEMQREGIRRRRQ